jgi:hypothetical protein
MNARHSRLAFAAAFAALVLVARASDAGDAGAPAGHYKDNGDGTVTDNRSGLTWQKAAPGAYTWATAVSYCSNPTGLTGTGWRLPTVKELFTLLDVSQTSGPYIDRVAFPSTPSDAFWSSTLVAGSSGLAWSVSFNLGNTSSYDVSNTYYVRCVR